MKRLDIDVSPQVCQYHKPYIFVQSILVKSMENNTFWPGDLDLWPMTLTFKVDQDGIQVHVHTKSRDPSYHTYRDMNYCLVNFGIESHFWSSNRRKAMHKSPPCISTGSKTKTGVLANPKICADVLQFDFLN